MSSYDLIEAALHRAAELAPDERRIQSMLQRQASAHRGRRALLIAGGALVAGAGAAVVGIPLLTRGPRETSVTYPSVYPTGSVAGAGNSRAVMVLRPGWLPDGVVEIGRTATLGDPEFTQTRVWRSADFDPVHNQGTSITLMVRPRRVASWPDSGDAATSSAPTGVENSASPPVPISPGDRFDKKPANTTINGRKGWLDEPAGPGPRDHATVDWLLNNELVATLEMLGVPDSDAAVLRMANSVTADGTSVCEAPLRFGWLPSELPGDRIEVGVARSSDGTPAYSITLDRSGPTTGQERIVTVQLGPKLVDATGDRVTVRGRAGFCTYSENTYAGTASGLVVVQLADGRWLTVEVKGLDLARRSRADAIRIVNELWIGPNPDPAWFGTR